MSLGEKAGYYCKSLGKSCAEGILLAANEEYGLGLTQDEVQLFAGFRTGLGGALAGAVGALSRPYRRRAGLKELWADSSALYGRGSGSSAQQFISAPRRRSTLQFRAPRAATLSAM